MTDPIQWPPPRNLCSIDLDGLDEKLGAITKELNANLGINTKETAIRYLIMTYVLTAKVVHSEEGND